MINNKIWKIKNYEGTFTDEEIVYLIKSGKLTGNDSLNCKDMKGYMKIKDSIYEYYLKKGNDKNETV